jgi:phosphatidylglycerophosphate synthase
VAQPEWLLARAHAEHWAGRLYMRRFSPYLTRAFLATPLSATAVTAFMLPTGLLAGLSLTFSGLLAAIGAVALVQLQLLLDCSDGELARWRGQSSAVGIYLDRISHYLTETAIPIALGVRADGGWDSLGGWTTLGLVVAVLVLLVRTESALVHVARSESGRPPAADTVAVAAPRGSLLRRARRALDVLPFFRAFVAVEATLLALAAAIVDVAGSDLSGTRALLVAMLPLAAITAAGHLFAIIASSRLR